MKILFLHPNMPGQYKHLCRAFAAERKHQIIFLTHPKPEVNISGVKKVEFTPRREPSKETHRYLANTERGIIRGQDAWRVCFQLKKQGFVPDVMVGHCGWGDGLFLKDIFPDTPLLSFFEFYYHAQGADTNFDPDDPLSDDDIARIRIKNTVNLINLDGCDWGISPTWWQYGLHPKEFHSKMSMIHDGVDTRIAIPKPDVTITLPGDIKLSRKDKIVTYIARNFEPYRGLPTFIKAAKMMLEADPELRIIAVGADGVSYGKKPPEPHDTWRHMWLEEVGLKDPNHKLRERIHFVGYLPYDKLLRVMQISSAHIYLTYPFVLSWSMLEAMSCGAVVIGSKTKPVEEVINHEENGLLVDFFSPDELASTVEKVLNHKDRMQEIRDNARKTVEEYYALEKLLPLHVDLVKDLANGKNPPPTHDKIMNLAEKLRSTNK